MGTSTSENASIVRTPFDLFYGFLVLGQHPVAFFLASPMQYNHHPFFSKLCPNLISPTFATQSWYAANEVTTGSSMCSNDSLLVCHETKNDSTFQTIRISLSWSAKTFDCDLQRVFDRFLPFCMSSVRPCLQSFSFSFHCMILNFVQSWIFTFFFKCVFWSIMNFNDSDNFVLSWILIYHEFWLFW